MASWYWKKSVHRVNCTNRFINCLSVRSSMSASRIGTLVSGGGGSSIPKSLKASRRWLPTVFARASLMVRGGFRDRRRPPDEDSSSVAVILLLIALTVGTTAKGTLRDVAALEGHGNSATHI